MAELTVQTTYGKALYEASKEVGKEKELIKECKEVQKILENEPDFFMVIKDPTISSVEKKKLVDNVFKKEISDELLNLFYILIDKKRIGYFPYIINEFEKLVNKEEGVVYGVCYAPIKLSKKRLREIEEETSKLLKEKVKLTGEIDTSLIGGLKLLVGGKVIDASIKNSLENMASELIR